MDTGRHCKNFLIFSVGRKGCTDYAYNVISNFSTNSFDLYLSKYYDKEILNRSTTSIYTYKSSISFFIFTVFYFPFILFRILCNIIRKKYTAVYFPYFHHWNIFVQLLFKILGKKSIVTVHDGLLHPGDGYPFEQLLNKLTIKLADKTIFLTSHVQKITMEKIKRNIKSVIIPHGIIKMDGIKGKARKYKECPKILFIGRINKYKGVENLIEAVSMIEDDVFEKLTIVGKTNYPIQIPKSSKIEIIDKWLDETEFAFYINTYDILILPNIEATQSGILSIGIDACIPMVCSKVGGLTEQLIENEEALFAQTNPLDLKLEILRLIKDKDLYEKISDNLQRKKATLTWTKISDQVQNYILSN